MQAFRRMILACITLCLLCAYASAQDTFTLNNGLGLNWSWDPTYVEVPADQAQGVTAVRIQGSSVKVKMGKEEEEIESQPIVRPAQIELVEVDGKKMARVWFMATIQKPEAKYKGKDIKTATPRTFTVTLLRGEKAPVDLSLKKDGDFYLVDNKVYEFKVRNYSGPIGKPFQDVPHWMGGMRVKGEGSKWDGRAWFEGTTEVASAKTEVINQGAVFIDFKVSYTFADVKVDGEVEALPMALGKQTHKWEPNKPPRETLPKKDKEYTLLIRCWADDAWIEVNERYNLPRDKNVAGYGVHQYRMMWGTPTKAVVEKTPWIPAESHIPVDTISWVRWFEYDAFGGNTNQNYVKAEPRPAQKGRPFVLLRPRWNQGPGGGQDFVATSGGSPKYMPKKKPRFKKSMSDEEKAEIQAKYDKKVEASKTFNDQAAAVGIVASFASKWVGPYPGTIAGYAFDGNRAEARFSLIDGEPRRSKMYYGQRSYALLCGPRRDFHHLNGLVRRHTDWTLVAQTTEYILDWERDPSKAGPNIKISRKELEQIKSNFSADKDTPIVNKVKETLETLEKGRAKADEYSKIAGLPKKLSGTIANAKKQISQIERGLKKLDSEKDLEKIAKYETELKDWKAKIAKAEAGLPAAKEAAAKLTKKQKNFHRTLNKDEYQLAKLIAGTGKGSTEIARPHLWIGRRYQDDFLNPTQRAGRSYVHDIPVADLFTDGKPIGGAWQAAIGYIFTDLDNWPGWHQGWTPGNPNFHTDKYLPAVLIGAAMRDHPHSDDWLQFGVENFYADIDKVLLPPDGVGFECPGYSGYSLGLQLETASLFLNCGFGNPVAENELFKKSGSWHRKLLTPHDIRLDLRHEAPIGDTHRWTSGLNQGFGMLAKFYKEKDPAFASEMMGALSMIPIKKKKQGLKSYLRIDYSIPAMDPKKMDWSSEAFYGFGVIMRNNFGTDQESFLTVKSGPARGHAHNEETSYHFYSDGTPVSLDYNCSYHPRGDHAGLHNRWTFGGEKQIKNNSNATTAQKLQDQIAKLKEKDDPEKKIPSLQEKLANAKKHVNVNAMEELGSTGIIGAFVTTDKADLTVTEVSGSGLSLRPLDPHDHEFQRKYPYRKTSKMINRRFITFVKHPVGSKFTDYLVVRDEVQSTEPQQLNIHLLAREAKVDGNTIFAPGQWDKDMIVYLADATDPKVDVRSWHYYDEWCSYEEKYLIKPGESQEEWAKRLEGVEMPKGDNRVWTSNDRKKFGWYFKRIKETDGKAMMPPPGWQGTWMSGEYQVWLRISTKPGTPVLWVLYPYERKGPKPTIETIEDGKGVKITVDGESEEVVIAGTGSDVILRSGGKEEVLLKADAIPALGKFKQGPDLVSNMLEEEVAK